MIKKFDLSGSNFSNKKKNNRSSSRFQTNLQGEYYFNEWIPCRIDNLSYEGAAISVRQTLFKDDVLKLKLFYNKSSTILDAVVVRSDSRTVGIHFEDVSEFQREIIKNLGDLSLKDKFIKPKKLF